MVHVCISWRQYPFPIRQNSWIHISHCKLFYKNHELNRRLYSEKRVLFTRPDGIKGKFVILLRRETCLRHMHARPPSPANFIEAEFVLTKSKTRH